MGCSNPHPHGQIWANSFLPNEAEREDLAAKSLLRGKRPPDAVDYTRRELPTVAVLRSKWNTGWLKLYRTGRRGSFKRCCRLKHMSGAYYGSCATHSDDLALALKKLTSRC